MFERRTTMRLCEVVAFRRHRVTTPSVLSEHHVLDNVESLSRIRVTLLMS